MLFFSDVKQYIPVKFTILFKEIKRHPRYTLKEFLETLVDRNLDENFRPKTPCKHPKIARMSDRQVIMDAKQRKNRQSDRKPRLDLQEGIQYLQTGAMMRRMTKKTRSGLYGKTYTTRPQLDTSFVTYPGATLPRILTFGRGKMAPLASGTLTIGCGCSIPIDHTATAKEAAIALVPPSPHKIVHNDSMQIYEEPPAPVRPRHALANWTSIRLGNDPNRHTVDEMTNGPQNYNLIIDAADQQIEKSMMTRVMIQN